MTDRSAISELLQDMLHISRQAADPVADAICRLQPARVPEGWQLVPRELTKEMFYARDRAPFVWSDKFATVQLQWREMLSAGPAAEGGMAEPVAWLVDWPDDPELGHSLSEWPVPRARNRPLGVIANPAPESREADKPEAGQREGVEAVKQSLTGGGKNER